MTHTAPFVIYVEIGITPLNDENAAYLYGIFGKDKVKVVDGQKVITMSALGAAGAVVLLGGTAILLKRRKQAAN